MLECLETAGVDGEKCTRREDRESSDERLTFLQFGHTGTIRYLYKTRQCTSKQGCDRSESGYYSPEQNDDKET